MRFPTTFVPAAKMSHFSSLEAIKDSLASGGRVVVSLPNEATLFHRIRCLLGTVDAECFASQGKHLHLPNLRQCRTLLSSCGFQIVEEEYYISLSFQSSRQKWLKSLCFLLPESILQLLANAFPSLFARGFIFACRVKSPELLAFNDGKSTEV